MKQIVLRWKRLNTTSQICAYNRLVAVASITGQWWVWPFEFLDPNKRKIILGYCGGIESATRALARALRKAGHRVTIRRVSK